MSLLTTLLWIFLACGVLMGYALFTLKGAKLMKKAMHLDQKAEREGRYSKWGVVRLTPWLIGSLSLTTFFDNWSVKLAIFAFGLFVATIIEFKKVREMKARHELTEEI